MAGGGLLKAVATNDMRYFQLWKPQCAIIAIVSVKSG
jgi:hypothetical protein